MKTGNDGFARKIAEQLEKSANDLDSHTRMRLRGMRRRAIEQASRKTPFWFRGTPMLAFASVAAIALTVALWPRPPGPCDRRRCDPRRPAEPNAGRCANPACHR
jgi:hypothetical protein